MDENDLMRVMLGVMTVHILKQIHGEQWRDALREAAHGTSPPHLVVDEEMVDLYDELERALKDEENAG